MKVSFENQMIASGENSFTQPCGFAGNVYKKGINECNDVYKVFV
jgi:hypothetical protein